jgi:hypothetical protein
MDLDRTGTPAPAKGRRGALLILFISIGGFVAALWKFTLRPESPRAEPAQSVASRDQVAGGAEYSAPSSAGYVGSEACTACHDDIARAYQSHPMARSIVPVDLHSENLTSDLSARLVSGKSRYFVVEGESGTLRHHERMADADGKLIYDQAVEMQYVVGSGRRAKAYLHERGGLLFMSPLNWYRQSGRWDLAPGYIADDPRRFERRVTEECISCHVGRAAVVDRGLNRFERPPFHEMAIGCENCHGPGEPHIAWRSSDAPQKTEDPIVNPARLDPARRDSVCFQCHLQAAARIPRVGRTHLDFRPGQLLEDIWTILDSGSDVGEDGRTRSVNHVQQMRESRCFLGSEGRFGCTSCHDPHRVYPEAERDARYRERCLECHQKNTCSLPLPARQEQNDSCIACHMPARESSNVAHVTQTDHRVPRKPSVESMPKSRSETLSFLDRADLRLSPLEKDRAMGLGVWLRLSKTGRQVPDEIPRLLWGVHDEIPEDAMTTLALGDIATQRGKSDLSRRFYEEALKNPESEEAGLNGLLEVYYLASEHEAALRCADRLIEIDPGHAKAHAIRADLLRASGRLEEGIAAARKALELNPTLEPVRKWLAESLERSGDKEGGRRELEILDRMSHPQVPGAD